MPKAWIEDGRVRDVAPGDPNTFYHPSVAVHYDTEVPEGTRSGATYVDGMWANPAPPEQMPQPLPSLADRKAALREAVRTERTRRLDKGILIEGVGPLRTGDGDRAMLQGAVSLLAADETLQSLDWEVQPHTWATIDRHTLAAMGRTVALHVESCFSRSRALVESIEAAVDHTALDAINIGDDANWPS
ncbi:DUF4376 domain-containing protein [Roseospira marina]|uniref:DUF4376 domain-containing protein n=1 Tax=Roseospira marina TaxID=140057 RepID=A0A5M6IBU6_9PROT|nr:DUF4376 domain-containing protein [Roseospira marina]KAA5605427.1 DUF4376 domain-containing protein [Roseospira marina]MBB4314579.1 hypothetical protein [Roseospira marina]MBB5088859.1 hypothetical protein [Roseospira marina]